MADIWVDALKRWIGVLFCEQARNLRMCGSARSSDLAAEGVSVTVRTFNKTVLVFVVFS